MSVGTAWPRILICSLLVLVTSSTSSNRWQSRSTWVPRLRIRSCAIGILLPRSWMLSPSPNFLKSFQRLLLLCRFVISSLFHLDPVRSHRVGSDNSTFPHHTLPKMSFPKFTGGSPKIWKDKSLDYFISSTYLRVCGLLLLLWIWTKMLPSGCKCTSWHSLGSWSEFIAVVE